MLPWRDAIFFYCCTGLVQNKPLSSPTSTWIHQYLLKKSLSERELWRKQLQETYCFQNLLSGPLKGAKSTLCRGDLNTTQPCSLSGWSPWLPKSAACALLDLMRSGGLILTLVITAWSSYWLWSLLIPAAGHLSMAMEILYRVLHHQQGCPTRDTRQCL